MQTLYYKTSSFIQHSGNIIDLAEVRRRQELVRQESLARQLNEATWEQPEEEPAFRPVVLTITPEERRRARWERRAWRLDVCASLGVILMTLLFALRMLL